MGRNFCQPGPAGRVKSEQIAPLTRSRRERPVNSEVLQVPDVTTRAFQSAGPFALKNNYLGRFHPGRWPGLAEFPAASGLRKRRAKRSCHSSSTGYKRRSGETQEDRTWKALLALSATRPLRAGRSDEPAPPCKFPATDWSTLTIARITCC